MSTTNFLPRLLCFILAMLLAGCSSTPKVDWDSRVGTYTYDQAVRNMGPPDHSSRLSDGVTVADWLTQRGGAQGYVGTGTDPARNQHNDFLVQPYFQSQQPNRYLRLTFGPDGRLRAWERVSK